MQQFAHGMADGDGLVRLAVAIDAAAGLNGQSFLTFSPSGNWPFLQVGRNRRLLTSVTHRDDALESIPEPFG